MKAKATNGRTGLRDTGVCWIMLAVREKEDREVGERERGGEGREREREDQQCDFSLSLPFSYRS